MFGNISKMMKLAGELKTRLPEMKQKLSDSEYAGQSPDGKVHATVNGRLLLVKLTIDPDLAAGADAAAISEKVLAAVAAAQEVALAAAEKAMKELTGGMEIPGLDGML